MVGDGRGSVPVALVEGYQFRRPYVVPGLFAYLPYGGFGGHSPTSAQPPGGDQSPSSGSLTSSIPSPRGPSRNTAAWTSTLGVAGPSSRAKRARTCPGSAPTPSA